MSAIALRRALGQAARMLGVRAESTIAAPAAAAAASSKLAGLSEVSLPSSDPIMQPYYQQIAEMEVYSAASPRQASESERASELAMLRMHNMSLPRSVYEGHMIKATVLEIGRRTVTLDTGLRPARLARSEITADCIIGSTRPDTTPRRSGELREGDVVQVFLESAGTPEGDFLVSGVQAAVQRRMAAVWNELEEKQARGELVKGRILNAVWGGYAVGVAGLVGFVPAKQCARPTARRIGQLQKFRILEVNRSRPSLVLADPNLHFGSPEAKQRTSSFFNPKRVLRQEDAQRRREARRQELTRVADELRSVLALRGSNDGSSGGSGSGSSSKPQS
ncbi:30S ribosomal S1 isoform A [Chlorella sorokiniana]|uniref:30S ribosomal S1 isoform A n=1 Tax=Chlorella sorokiniana TaxID=3076 RepID=A0A2P6U2B0_CHLSO|nr:30S ribosomal S1 isoform A [Chlorella sorokiniana]|eukprot:PRW60439.1 30S ribosomal S1 isoform A [Chlorella sorokiniana]